MNERGAFLGHEIGEKRKKGRKLSLQLQKSEAKTGRGAGGAIMRGIFGVGFFWREGL